MLDILIHMLAILDDMNEEIDRMAKHANGRTTGIGRRIQKVRRELRKLEASVPSDG